MIRICPKCGAYHADDSSAFCLGDGTPLVNVDPSSNNWREGTRVIEAKGKALRKQQRKLKWRRVLVTSMTMMIATMIVCVVAINGWIYLTPAPAVAQLSQPSPSSTPSPTPSLSPIPIFLTIPSPTPSPLEIPLTIPSPTPSPRMTGSPTPTPSPRVMRSPPPTPSPRVTRSPTPTPSPRETRSPTPIPFRGEARLPTPTPSIKCSKADLSRESKAIREVVPAKLEKRAEGTTVSLSLVDYHPLVQTCTTASVRVTYSWQGDRPLRSERLTGWTEEVDYICQKDEGTWHCRR